MKKYQWTLCALVEPNGSYYFCVTGPAQEASPTATEAAESKVSSSISVTSSQSYITLYKQTILVHMYHSIGDPRQASEAQESVRSFVLKILGGSNSDVT